MDKRTPHGGLECENEKQEPRAGLRQRKQMLTALPDIVISSFASHVGFLYTLTPLFQSRESRRNPYPTPKLCQIVFCAQS